MKPTDDELLKTLKEDALKLPVLKPRAMAWDKVKANLPTSSIEGEGELESSVESSNVVHVSFGRRLKFPLTIAASFVVGVLVTSISYQLDKTSLLDEQIALSRQYESQLVAFRMSSPLVESQLWQISQIDQQLNQSITAKQRQQLWTKRNELLRQILTSPTHSNEMI